ncbi:MAG TPA: tRNA (adenosine(37)-N6)-threonylcarbamoyltransferase complex transferase subunit TsaD [Patescibacteria group bacterium]
MRILGIETSCDETAAAIVEDRSELLTNVVASSADLHAKTGGVIPEFAARQQVKSIIPVINEALGKFTKDDIDAIAVTVGPGLIGSLLVGIETAKTLAYLWDKPIIPVNHLVGHVYANWINVPKPPLFPALALVVSGGHTDLVLMTNPRSEVKIAAIGSTRDDAAGEAFDKTARLLNLPYPGGPAISKLASQFRKKYGNTKLNLFPRPMINDDNFDFSFSGLKTAVLNEIKDKKITPKYQELIAAEIEEAIVEVLVEKTAKAIQKYQPSSFLLAGGVAANSALRERFEEKIYEITRHVLQAKTEKPSAFGSGIVRRTRFHVPAINLCTDNAAYIAAAAFSNYVPKFWSSIKALPELTITSKLEV